ncbi:hypothetical protein BZA77DRAFT_77253 [Pyronema omphalodes]|nr:hypothetical protein BZA77DRAFT_77253 [Pyronema omphalodes]
MMAMMDDLACLLPTQISLLLCCLCSLSRSLSSPTTYSTLSPGLPWGATSTSRVILCSPKLSNWTTRLKPCSVLSRKPNLPYETVTCCGRDVVMR